MTLEVLKFSTPGLPAADAADDIRQRIVRLYAAVSPGGQLPADGERGELDSLAFLEFIVSIEQEFAIVVETRDLEGATFSTTANTTAYVRRKLGLAIEVAPREQNA